MKTFTHSVSLLAVLFGLVLPARAQILVNDTWIDGLRTDPASPIYSENGVDGDVDGNLESAWFRGGAGAMSVASGILQKTTGAGASSSWSTYFTPDASPVTLLNTGDQLRITWAFTPTTVNSASTGQGFRMAIVDTPNAARVATDASPGSSTYSGYGMFMNMNTTLGNSNPFQLMERTAPGTSSALLSASASWTGLDDEETSGVTGYASGTLYTFVFTATRTVAGELDLAASMTGGSIGGDGALNVSFTDTTPNGGSFSFDTFSLRPSTLEDSAAQFDTSLFRVELAVVPEPTTFALAAVGALTLVALRRRVSS